MCVKQTGENGLVEGDLSPDTFQALEPALTGIQSLVLSGIGEPLLNPNLENYIRRAKALMPGGSWVGFQSNGLLLDHARAVSLVNAGVDRICLSLDAVSASTFREIREGGEVETVERALAAVASARADSRPPDVEVGIEFVAMRDNVRELPEVLRWAARRGATFALITQVLPYTQALVDQAAYDANTDVAVSFFGPWRQRARRQGVDIDRYYEVLWKYSKTPEEQTIVDFIEEVKEKASSRDIFVNVEKILGRDPTWYREVEEIFAQAKIAAEESGLDLRLPEVIPRGDRRCEFVEGGGLFVSWDGRVHPCYFLWHGYRCFINGREKFVKPRVLGDLAERGILDIWNDRSYRSFRESVIRYDFPFCSDCNLAKCCDYVQADEFEQDCYINAEPCGDCLWSKGVFQCLQ
jgi:putative metalloenzyme radical SAM/SPASM domain maturase